MRRAGEQAGWLTKQDQNEHSEDPTQRRLDQALKRGDVVKSHEVNTWFVIAATTLIVMGFSGSMTLDLTKTMRGVIANSYRIPADGVGLSRLFEMLSAEVLAAMAIPLLLLALAAVGGNLIQHRLVWSYEQLTPKFSKISPVAGAKRLFSKQALMGFVKGLIKLVLIGGVLFMLMWPERSRMENMVAFDAISILDADPHPVAQASRDVSWPSWPSWRRWTIC